LHTALLAEKCHNNFQIIFVLCLKKCIYHLHIGPSPLYCNNNQHDFKVYGENQRIMLHDKTSIMTLIPLLQSGSERLDAMCTTTY